MKATERTHEALRILRGARKMIFSRDTAFICFAVAETDGCDEVKDVISDAVMESLGGYATFGGWLGHHAPECIDFRKVRLAYLDEWIAKHEALIRETETQP